MRRALLLLRWTFRDLRRRWVLVSTLALVVALATGVGAGLGSMRTWRERSNDKSFALLHMHDLRVSLTAGSYVRSGTLSAVASRIRDRRQILAQQERLVVPTQINASQPGAQILVPGRLVGVALSGTGAQIDRRFVERGRDLRPADAGRPVAVVERNFADFHSLPIPTQMEVAGGRSLTIVGRVYQPEQFLVTRPGADFGAEAGYGVLFAPLSTVQLLSRHAGQVNELVLAMRPGANAAAIEQELATSFARGLPSTGATITPKASEDSYRILYEDARGDQRLVDVFAWLLLAGAAFASFNLVSRVIEAQRREIGIGMALGVPPTRLALRPLLFAAEVSLLGVLIGIGVGLVFNGILRGQLQGLVNLPIWTTPLIPGIYARAAALGFAVPLLAALYPVARAVRVPPVAAIQSGTRSTANGGLAPLLERLRLPGSTLVKMPFRNVVRAPRRTLMSVLGIGAIITILISLGGALDSFDKTLALSRAETVSGNPARMVVTLTTMLPQGGATVQAIRKNPMIVSAEPTLILPSNLRSGERRIESSLELLNPASTVWRPRLTGGTFAAGADGIVISKRAARDLHVHIGDTIALEHPIRTGTNSFRTVASRVRISGLHPNPLRSLAYMDIRRANLFGLEGAANTVELRLAPHAQQSAVSRALFAIHGVASVEPAAAVPDALRRFLTDFLGFLRITQTITLLLALLIAFNTTSIAGDERRREHATMFAFGIPIRSVMTGSVVESMLIGILGTIVGLGAGLLVLGWVMNVVTADVFPDLGTVVSLAPTTIAVAVLLGVVAVALAPLFGIRRLRRMDIPSTLRVAE